MNQMYILGDVIDRNPDGIKILCEIMSADNMHMLLGNHEYMMINAIEDPGYHINPWFTSMFSRAHANCRQADKII